MAHHHDPPPRGKRSKARFYAILSLGTLAIQNTSLALVLHASRIAPQDGSQAHDRGAYFTPSAVLCTEVAKCVICASLLLFGIAKAKRTAALAAITNSTIASQQQQHRTKHQQQSLLSTTFALLRQALSFSTIKHACSLVFSESAWPLSFPAVLYVLQNNLQYTAAENLEPAVFQTLYQLKILTTALFSRILLGKRLQRKQWVALLVLAAGVAIVQVGSQTSHGRPGGPPYPPPPPDLPPSAQSHTGLLTEYASLMAEQIANIERQTPPIPEVGWPAHLGPGDNFVSDHFPRPPPPPPPHGAPFVGFLAVLSACVTSGLAGVWFEKVVKGGACKSSKPLDAEADDNNDDDSASTPPLDLSSCAVWLSALQLSLFSLAPALVPVLVKMYAGADEYSDSPYPDIRAPWRNFGTWAWSIVALQTAGGLVTALVVRWADNILKCFAVALALLLTSVLSIPLFAFELTSSFVLGAGLTLCATVLYQRAAGEQQKNNHEGEKHNATSRDDHGYYLNGKRRHGREEGDVLFDAGTSMSSSGKDEEAIALMPTKSLANGHKRELK